jgi:hypothetical protein
VHGPADCEAFSDASTAGLGGFSSHLNFQWRLEAGIFQCPSLNNEGPANLSMPHINILEFVSIIINIYFSIIALSSAKTFASLQLNAQSGVMINCHADNTSALSWMRYASRSHSVPVRNLSLFLVTLVFHANLTHPLQFVGHHLAGSRNFMADALSRPIEYPSYNSVFAVFPVLQDLRRCQVPQNLIAVLRSCLSPWLMAVPSETAMKKLLVPRLGNFRPSAP